MFHEKCPKREGEKTRNKEIKDIDLIHRQEFPKRKQPKGGYAKQRGRSREHTSLNPGVPGEGFENP